jgi:uncharacterized protein involved in outer membrane biogenesis
MAMRRAAAILGGIFLILILALLLAPFLVDLSFLKSRFLPQVESALGRSVDVGSIRLSLWSLGVQLKDIVVQDDPQFSSDDFFRSDSVIVSLRFLPLLRKRVEVSQLLVQRPEIHLIQDSDGRLNTSTLGKGDGKKSPPAEPSPPQEQRPIGVVADRVIVKNGRITYVRRLQDGPPVSTAAEDVDLTLSDLQLGKIVSINLETRIEPQGKQGRLKGRIGPLTTPLKPETIDLSGTVGRSDLHLTGGYRQGRLLLTANARQVDLDELMLLLPQRESPPNKPTGPPPASSRGATPMEVDFNLKKVQMKGMELSDFSGKGKINRKTGTLEDLTGYIWGGRFTGNGRVGLSGGTLPFSANFALQEVSLGSIIKQFVPVNPELFTGSASFQVGLNGSGGSWGALSRTLTGEGSWEVGEGEIKNVNLLGESLSILRVLDQVQLSLEPKTQFSSAKGAFKIDAGRIGVSNLSMDNPLFDLIGKGEIGLEGAYRIIGEMRLAESVTQQIRKTPAGALLPVQEGRLEVPIEIAGEAQNVRLAIREEALKEATAEQLRKGLSERLEKEGLGGLLKR